MRTDRHDEANGLFPQNFANASKKSCVMANVASRRLLIAEDRFQSETIQWKAVSDTVSLRHITLRALRLSPVSIIPPTHNNHLFITNTLQS